MREKINIRRSRPVHAAQKPFKERHRNCLPFDEWPEADHAAWYAKYGAPMGSSGHPSKGVAGKTIYERRKSYGKFLSYLASIDALDLKATPEGRTTCENVGGYIESVSHRLRPVSVKEELTRLTAALRDFAPEVWWGWIRRLPNAPRGKEVGRLRTKMSQLGQPHRDPTVADCANTMCRKSKPERQHIPVDEWPASDRDRWLRARSRLGLFDANAPLAGLAARSVSALELSYGTFLRFLRSNDRLDGTASPAARGNPINLNDYLANLRHRRRASSIAEEINRLVTAFGILSPEKDWAWIRRVSAAPQRAEVEASRKPIRPPDPAVVLKKALDMFDQAASAPKVLNSDIDARNALIISFNVLFALRLKNLCELEIGKHLIIDDFGAKITIFDSMKNNTAVTYDIPSWLLPRLLVYLREVRPRILGHHSDHLGLWVEARTGAKLSYFGLSNMFPRFGARILGRSLNCHVMRHAMANALIVRNIEDSELVAAALGHTTTEMVDTVYTRSASLEMSRKWLKQARVRRKQLGLEE